MSTVLRRIPFSLVLLLALTASTVQANEFLGLKARQMELVFRSTFAYVTRADFPQATVEATRDRLRTFVGGNSRIKQAQNWYVVAYTFDTYGDWIVEFRAFYDIDIQRQAPSAAGLLQTYFDLEQFFHDDPALNHDGWYARLKIADHGGP